MLETVKKIARATGNHNVPASFFFGTVTAVSPLTVRVDNRFDISGAALVSTRELRGGVYSTHTHEVDGVKTTAETYAGLTVGEAVVLLRNQGGQQYLVLGRV